MWLHLPVSPARVLTPYCDAVAHLVQMARIDSKKYFGKELQLIGVSFTKLQVDWLFQNSDAWAIAFANYTGTIENHYPSNKILQFVNLLFPRVFRNEPVEKAQTVFTDGSSNGAAFVMEGQTYPFQTTPASAQIVELHAVAAIFHKLNQTPFNLYTDTHYIPKALPILETVAYFNTANSAVQELFNQIQRCLHCQRHPCFVGHIRAHSGLAGHLTKGNDPVDQATRLIGISQTEETQHSHALYHQSSQSLRYQLRITRDKLLNNIPSALFQTVLQYGINPRGIKPNQI